MGALLDVLHALQRANERRDRAAVLALVAPDVEYHWHVGSKPLRGAEKLGRFLDRYWARAQDHVWRLESWAENGDRLLTEGYEEYTDAPTGKRIVNRYMGVMEFRDGRIARWRDYFQLDPAAVVPATASGPDEAASGGASSGGASSAAGRASSPFV